MKKLVLIRHAKSSWDHAGSGDAERSLNKRGKRDAPVMGQRLSERALGIELLVTSPAKRARKTAKAVAKALGLPRDRIRQDDRIYAAGTGDLLSSIADMDDSLSAVCLVGHNPAFTDLANLLSRGPHIDNVPTCGMVGFELGVSSWSEVAPGSAALAFFDYPKKPA
jgi:phosphohistidine phosphatase